jgi:hypothetical protein
VQHELVVEVELEPLGHGPTDDDRGQPPRTPHPRPGGQVAALDDRVPDDRDAGLAGRVDADDHCPQAAARALHQAEADDARSAAHALASRQRGEHAGAAVVDPRLDVRIRVVALRVHRDVREVAADGVVRHLEHHAARPADQEQRRRQADRNRGQHHRGAPPAAPEVSPGESQQEPHG